VRVYSYNPEAGTGPCGDGTLALGVADRPRQRLGAVGRAVYVARP